MTPMVSTQRLSPRPLSAFTKSKVFRADEPNRWPDRLADRLADEHTPEMSFTSINFNTERCEEFDLYILPFVFCLNFRFAKPQTRKSGLLKKASKNKNSKSAFMKFPLPNEFSTTNECV